MALFGLLLGALPAAPAAARAWAPQPARYGIVEARNQPIKMADGAILRADVYTPADPATGKPAKGRFPVIVGETPYGKELASGPSPADMLADYDPYFVQRGYIAVVVDVRGTGASGGQWNMLEPQEARDSVRVIDWAARLPHAARRVGMFGVSYGGIDQLFAAGAVGAHSPLKAIFPMMAGNDIYRELSFDGGLLNVESVPAYLGVTTAGNEANPLVESDPAGLLSLLTSHTTATARLTLPLVLNTLAGGADAYDGAFWQQRDPINVLSKIVRNHVAAYLVGGLYDVYQAGEPRNLSGLQNAADGRPVTAPMRPGQRVSGRYQLLIGPWYHTTFDVPTVQTTALDWFDRWLKGQRTGIDHTRTPLHLIEAGARKLALPGYPDAHATPRTFYLAPGAALTRSVPAAPGADPIVFSGGSLPCDNDTEQFAIGAGALALSDLGLTDPCATHDLLPALSTPARLTYTSQPLSAPSTIAGPIDATLFATATTTDTEWIAKVEDVAPDGQATELTSGALLGSMRALDAKRTWYGGGGRPLLPYHPYAQGSVQAVDPGAVTRYDVEIRPTFATLPAGHRLRLTITTSELPHLFPRADQLTHLIGGIYAVQHRPGAASYLQVPLLP